MSPRPRPAAYVDPQGEFPLDLTTYLFHLFVVIARHRDARLDEALEPLGLNVSRHRALSVIALLQPCAMSALAQFSAVDRTTMTRTVDQLVAAGFVERHTPPADRRQVILNLTRPGDQAYRKALKIIRALSEGALAGITPALQRQATRGLEAIAVNVVADPELAARLIFRKPQMISK